MLDAPDKDLLKKHAWIAVVLNLLTPGLGYAYIRNIKKAFAYYLICWIISLGVAMLAFSFFALLVIILLEIIVRIYLLVDVYRRMEKGNAYVPKSWDKWYVFIGLLLLHTLIANVFLEKYRTSAYRQISYASAASSSMDPEIKMGDYIAYELTKKIARNDVVCFKNPENLDLWIKRCIGMPGETLRVREDKILINGDTLRSGLVLKYRYTLRTDGSRLDPVKFESFDPVGLSENEYELCMTSAEADEFRELDFVKELGIHWKKEGQWDANIFPSSRFRPWNIDFGPLYIPRKGDHIELDEPNSGIYFKCIKYENKSADMRDGEIFIDGTPVHSYVFKENYYFLMGDNRHNTVDSRFWGLLPEQLVEGKVRYVFWSKSTDRVGKKIG